MLEKKDTVGTPRVGKIAYDLMNKSLITTDKPHTVVDQMQEQLSEYERNVVECVLQSRKTIQNNFYVIVLTKKERLMQNVLRNYFFARRSCPTPDYDQAVYLYDASTEDIRFLWVIPSRDTCIMLKQNALIVAPEERGLLKFVLEFDDGTLMKMSKKLNGESKNSPILEN